MTQLCIRHKHESLDEGLEISKSDVLFLLVKTQIIRTKVFLYALPPQKYREKCNGQINEIVELVRGKLEGGARIALGALTVVDVHGRYSLANSFCF